MFISFEQGEDRGGGKESHKFITFVVLQVFPIFLTTGLVFEEFDRLTFALI